MEMRCFRKILRISYKDPVTNEAVRNKTSGTVMYHDHLALQRLSCKVPQEGGDNEVIN